MVTLAEDLYLLACHDETGRSRIPVSHLDLGLGGALLLDLALLNRVARAGDHVVAVDRAAVGDPLLDTALAAVAGSARPHEPEHWVRHLAKGAREVVRRRLVDAGVLVVEDHRLLGVIAVHHLHQVDDRIEHEVVHRLYDAVVLGGPASPQTAAVVSLVLAVGLERPLFPRSDRRAIRRRMEEIAEREWAGAAVRNAVVALDAVLGIGGGSGLIPGT